jgi:hypothetical protein
VHERRVVYFEVTAPPVKSCQCSPHNPRLRWSRKGEIAAIYAEC